MGTGGKSSLSAPCKKAAPVQEQPLGNGKKKKVVYSNDGEYVKLTAYVKFCHLTTFVSIGSLRA